MPLFSAHNESMYILVRSRRDAGKWLSLKNSLMASIRSWYRMLVLSNSWICTATEPKITA